MAAERGAAVALRRRFARTLPTRSPGPAHGFLSVNLPMPNRPSLGVFLRRVAAIGAAAALAGAVHAQAIPDQMRAQVASARLGAGYAQMINLSATPDLGAASYRIDGRGPSAALDVLRLP